MAHFTVIGSHVTVSSRLGKELVTNHLLGNGNLPGCKGLDPESDTLTLVFLEDTTAITAHQLLESLAGMPSDSIARELAYYRT